MGVSLEEATEEVHNCMGAYYRLDWLNKVFIRQQAEIIFDCAARAYMMLLVGCTIFANKTFALVRAKYLSIFKDFPCGRYSWGSCTCHTL